MYAKLIEGAFYPAPRKLPVGSTIVYNPSEDMLLAEDYKPVVYTAEPETEPGYYAESHWEDDGESIVQVWEVIEEPADIDIPDEEAFSIIMGVNT